MIENIDFNKLTIRHIGKKITVVILGLRILVCWFKRI